MLKRAACLFLAVLMSIDSIAATVSDNDGAAFITKAEFDSLRNTFQRQINDYNENLNNKIDNAINGYLLGINVKKAAINLIERFEKTTGKKQQWLYALPGTGGSTVNYDLVQTVDCEVAIRRANNLSHRISKWEGASNQTSYWIATILWPSSTWSDQSGWQNYYAYQTWGGISDSAMVGLTTAPTGNFSSQTGKRTTSPASYTTYPQNTTVITHPNTGSGVGWLWQNFGNEKYNLKYYCTALYPSFNVIWRLHWYKYFPVTEYSYYYNSTGLTISDLSMPTNSTLESKWGTVNSVGTRVSSSTDTNLRNYAQISTSLVKTNNGTNYLDVVWGVNANTNIYGNDEDVIPELNSSTTSLSVPSSAKYTNQAFQREGLITFETAYPTKTQSVKLRNYKLIQHPLSYFCSNTLSNIASTEKVYIGNGSPCYNCPDADIRSTLKIKLTASSGTCSCNVKISDKPFNNGNVATGANTILNATFSTGTEKTYTLNNKGKGNYYIFIKNNTNTNPITIQTFDVK